MKKRRFVSLMLLSAMVLSLAACGGDAEETTAETTAAEVVDPEPEVVAITPDMPADLRFDDGESSGTVRCLGMETLVEGLNGTDEQEVPTIKQELYDRNRRVEERFGVTITFNNVVNWGADLPNAIRQSVNSGSNDYDVVFSTSAQQVSLINEGMYISLDELPWINLEKPWWNQDYIKSVSLNYDAPYALFGNMTYNQVERCSCIVANTTKLLDQHNIIADDLFELVDNGEWTLDKFTELVNMGYKDDNGNTKADDGDMFGIVYESGGGFAVNFLAYGAGIEFTDRDEFGYPVLNLNAERSVDLTDKLIKLFCNNQAVFVATATPYNQVFANGQSLFFVNRLFAVNWFRDMKDDFVILPIPKYDETIDGYHGAVDSLVQWGCVTISVADTDLEMVSAVLEQMCYDGYNTVTPLYYENELKLKYTRGDDIDRQSRIIDIITEGARTDFIYVNNPGGVSPIFTNAVKAGQNNFASYYAERGGLAEYKLKQLIEKYEERVYG